MSGMRILPDRICQWCGRSFKRKRYEKTLEDATIFQRRKFCSLHCANQRKTVGKHGLSWRARKHLKEKCEVCGSQKMIAAHHKDKNRQNNYPMNIETLCVVCHAKHHHGSLTRRELLPASKSA